MVLKDHWVISPAFYNALRFFIGKNFDNIIKYDCITDEDGHQKPAPKPKDQPFYGIGLIEFKNKFDENDWNIIWAKIRNRLTMMILWERKIRYLHKVYQYLLYY